MLKDGEPQIWKVTHNGVDTHAIHFHLFDVQVINRVGWDGAVRPPDANEIGWKETVKMSPLEDAIVALRPQKQANLPWPLPNSIRPLNVAKPIGSDLGFFGVNPDGNPVTVLNQIINFGWEYVWHCHLLGHEENDMMRPSLLAVAPEVPTNLVGIKNPNGASIDLSWVDNSMGETGFTVQRATDDTFATNLVEISLGANVTTYTDSGLDPNGTYFWRVYANNLVGDVNTLGFPVLTANSVPTPAIGFNPSGPITITVTVPNGGESWITGSTHNVTWTQASMTGLANIDLYKAGVFVKTLGTADVTTGTFAWTIAVSETGGTDYRIRVGQGGMWDESNANFTIVHTAVKADFNGDGQEDILWRYYAGGQYQGWNIVWYMNQTGLPAAVPLAANQQALGRMKSVRGVAHGKAYRTPLEVGGSRIPVPPRSFTNPLGAGIAQASKSIKVMSDPVGIGRGVLPANQRRIGGMNLGSHPSIRAEANANSGGIGTAKIAALNFVTQDYLVIVQDTAWEIAGVGDFNGDGKTDVLWRYYGTGPYQGWNSIWFMNGTTIIGQALPDLIADTNWRVDGVGDFNGDGKADILWRYYGTGPYQGWNSIWYMDGGTIIGQALPEAITDTSWQIAGAGDFNGDGRADILWRYYGTGPYQGWNSIWYMNGATIIGQALPDIIPDTNWKVVGTGDFDADGKADMLWRYYGTGSYQGWNTVWYMNGGIIKNQEILDVVPDTNWRIVNR